MRLAPWQVKGIGPQARESAREAARRSGMSVGQWLNAVILDQAAEAGVDDDGYEDAAYHQHGEDLASITERLDDLGRQIDRLAGKPADPGDRGTSQRIADAIATLHGRLDRLMAEGRDASSALEQRVNSVDQALAKLSRERVRAAASYAGGDPVSVSIEQATAEIAARQRALDAEFAAPADSQRQPAPAPLQCRADAAVDSLRKDLTEIGRAISAALPREAVETLEGEVRALGTRLEAAHRPDAPSVAGLERGLHEVRDALRGLAPAESLTGFDAAIRTLSHKIDAIAEARRDPAGLQQLETAIAPLRDLVGRVASADALAALSQEVRSLAGRIEGAAPAARSADVLASLDRRIASIADAIEAVRGQAGPDPSTQLDRLVGSLNEKLDRLQAAQSAPHGEALVYRDLEDSIAKLTEKVDASQGRLSHLEAIERDMAELSTHLKAMQAPPVAALDYRDGEPSAVLSRGEQIALGGLEDRIAKLSEKLDASEGRLGHLASIERGMAELLTHLEAMRAAPPVQPAPPSPAPSAPRETPAPEPVAPPVAPVETLSQDIAALRQAQSAAARRTRDSLEDVQGTIETVVDRLATIETTIRNEPPGMPLPPGPEPAPEPPASEPSPPRAVSPAMPPAVSARSARAPSAPRQPIDPSLPADHPLEPGSGPPRPRPASAAASASQAAIPAPSATVADRVAASEAPLRAVDGAAAEPEPKSNYLQAARRAAQMAQATQRGAAPAAVAATLDKAAGGKLAQRLKTVLVAASVAVIVLATLRFAMTFFFEFAELETPGALAERAAPAQAAEQADDPMQGAMSGATQVPVIIARPGSMPAGPASSVSIVPLITRPAGPVLAQPIAPPASPVPSIAPPDTSLSPLFAPFVASAPLPAVPRPEQAPAPAAAPPASGDVTGTIPPSPPRQGAIPPATPAPASADRLPSAIGGPGLIAAASAGEPAAAYEIATRFAEGRRVPQSFAQAAIWYERAAKGGLAPALFRLGALYEKGEGVAKDLNEARRLYLAAADKGNVNAMHNIGVLYSEGIDGKPDFKSASQWFRKSAMHGVADSQYNLAVLYARGIGLERDFAEAFRWFSLAAKSGDTDAAKKRDEIAAHLDAKSLSVARQAVDGFVPAQAPEDAATVKPPPGGWDQAQPAKRKPATSARVRTKAQAI